MAGGGGPSGWRRRRVATVAASGAVLVASACAAGPSGSMGSSSTGAPAGSMGATAPPASATGPGTAVPATAAPGTAVPATAVAARPSPGCAPRAARPRPTVGSGTHESLTTTGTVRTYERWVPTGYDGRSPLPLVLDFHGYSEGAVIHTAMSGLGPFGDTHGFVTLTPQGTGSRPFWNAVPVAGGPDDLRFVEDLLDATGQGLCIDLARVYATGLSNGAFLSSLLACRLADRVAAIAPVAGLLMPVGCSPSRPVPVVAFHGTADGLVGYATDGYTPAAEALPMDDQARAAIGPPRLPFRNLPDTLAAWAVLDGCPGPPTSTPVTPAVTRIAYGGCRDGAAVELYRVEGGGHTWPGSAVSAAAADVLGPTTTEIDATALLWDFFVHHPLPPR